MTLNFISIFRMIFIPNEVVKNYVPNPNDTDPNPNPNPNPNHTLTP